MRTRPKDEHPPGVRAIRLLAVPLAVAALLSISVAADAQQCTPTGFPAVWPAGGDWMPYSSLGDGIQDEIKGPDGSYGSPPEPDAVDIYNGDNGDKDSLYWYFDTTLEIFYFRQRLEGDPRMPNDPIDFKNYTWTTNMDLTGDGYSDILVQVNGYTNTVQVMYDSDGDNLFDPTPCTSGGDIVFEYSGLTTRRVTDDTPNDGGWLLDWQLPLCAFSTCNAAEQIVTSTTPFSLTFTTSTNDGNPTLKDGGFAGDYKTAGDRPLPGGDACSLDGTCTERPYATVSSATCNGDPTTSIDLTTQTLDALVVDNTGCTDHDGCVVDTIDNVMWEYKLVGVGGAEDWTTIGTATSPDPGTLNVWSTTWTLPAGIDLDESYWIRVTITDDDGNTNDFEYENNGDKPGQFALTDLIDCEIDPTQSLPVSLAWVRPTSVGGRTRVEWATVTESGNLGFTLYGLHDGRWRRLTDRLVPSGAVDSVEPLFYEIEVTGSYAARTSAAAPSGTGPFP